MSDSNVFSCCLGEEEIAGFLGDLPIKEVEAETLMWAEGDQCSYTAIIESGKVELRKSTGEGEPNIVIGIFGEGSVIGEECFSDQSTRVLGAYVLEHTRVRIIPAERIDTILNGNPQLGVKILRALLLLESRRLSQAYQRLISVF